MAELTSLDLDQIIFEMGQVGQRLTSIGGSEGAAGNISVCIRDPLDISLLFPQNQMMDLPVPAPELAGPSFAFAEITNLYPTGREYKRKYSQPHLLTRQWR